MTRGDRDGGGTTAGTALEEEEEARPPVMEATSEGTYACNGPERGRECARKPLPSANQSDPALGIGPGWANAFRNPCVPSHIPAPVTQEPAVPLVPLAPLVPLMLVLRVLGVRVLGVLGVLGILVLGAKGITVWLDTRKPCPDR